MPRKFGKIQISRFLRFVLKQLVCQNTVSVRFFLKEPYNLIGFFSEEFLSDFELGDFKFCSEILLPRKYSWSSRIYNRLRARAAPRAFKNYQFLGIFKIYYSHFIFEIIYHLYIILCDNQNVFL